MSRHPAQLYTLAIKSQDSVIRNAPVHTEEISFTEFQFPSQAMPCCMAFLTSICAPAEEVRSKPLVEKDQALETLRRKQGWLGTRRKGARASNQTCQVVVSLGKKMLQVVKHKAQGVFF